MARTLIAMAARRPGLARALAAGCAVVLGFSCSNTPGVAAPGARGTLLNVGSREAPLRLWVEAAGSGDPILFIHGLGANSYSWRHLAPRLARTHHVLSVDLKGFGRSDKPVDDAYGVLDQALLLETLIKRKGLRRVTIVGHSLGGGVALALTLHLNLTQPETVARLVLLDSIAYRQPVPLFIELLRTPVLADVGLLAAPPELEVYKGLVAAYADPQKITLAAVSAYARPLYDPGGRHALVKTAQGIIPAELSTLTARYRTIQQPTLLIWCSQDRVVPPWVGRRLARALPNARLSLLKGCGHVPQEEEPAATLGLIKTFLDGRSEASRP
ncbi:MAG TPA: alpha/beta hydrolase [Hyphomicrobiaceae bacterium]|jgi:pimeloyl-ACP methyl ester carboxylesterase|nr:alpha/beta hydrolase [Hyphomicrobiaceae bacterium]